MFLDWQRQTNWNLLRTLGVDFDGGFKARIMPLCESQLRRLLAMGVDVIDDEQVAYQEVN